MVYLEAAKKRYPLPASAYKPYIRPVIPPLNINSLSTAFLLSGERSSIKTPLTGNASLVLWYKGCEIALVSWGANDTDLSVLQLQGAKSRKSWRESSSLDWTSLFADQTLSIAVIPEVGVKRITMPQILKIEGITSSESEAVIERYQAFLARAIMAWSQTEQQFVRDLTRK